MFISEWVRSPNFLTGRGGKVPIAIINHITSGQFPGCLDWMCNPIAKVSAHYLVTKTGRIIQMVKEGDSAYHAGIVNKPTWPLYDGTNPNKYTLGIEHEGQPGDRLTEDQYQATLWLHRDLTQKYRIPISKNHIIGHNQIDSVNRQDCPGSGFPWNRLLKDLEKGDDMLDIAILLNTKDDYWSGADVAETHGGCAVFVRGTDKSVPKDALGAKKLIVIGGPTTRHHSEVLLSGETKYDTAAAVFKYLGK